MKIWLALALVAGLPPGRALAQISTDTCCRPVGSRLPRRSNVAGPVAVLPTCYAPVLAGAGPLTYNPAQPKLLVFRWKSGAPIYATDEQFIFRLVAMPAGQVLLEQKTASRQAEWPSSLRLPAGVTGLYYTVQASRRDAEGQQCMSQVAQGTVQLPQTAATATHK
jgi:hypothetical protein